MKVVCCILLVMTGALAGDGDDTRVEGRGKAKYALLMHFFYVVATKLFLLKIVYGAIFYALIIKGWHFVSWFIHYLKEKKHKPYVPNDHVSYGPVSYGHNYGHHYSAHDHYGHENYGPDHYGHDHYEQDNYGEDYVSDSFNSYAFDQKRYDSKKAYDADGSYSVKS